MAIAIELRPVAERLSATQRRSPVASHGRGPAPEARPRPAHARQSIAQPAPDIDATGRSRRGASFSPLESRLGIRTVAGCFPPEYPLALLVHTLHPSHGNRTRNPERSAQ